MNLAGNATVSLHLSSRRDISLDLFAIQVIVFVKIPNIFELKRTQTIYHSFIASNIILAQGLSILCPHHAFIFLQYLLQSRVFSVAWTRISWTRPHGYLKKHWSRKFVLSRWTFETKTRTWSKRNLLLLSCRSLSIANISSDLFPFASLFSPFIFWFSKRRKVERITRGISFTFR